MVAVAVSANDMVPCRSNNVTHASRTAGTAAASKAILKIGDDRRVPLRQIYDLYAGKLKPEDVLKAARAGKPAPPALNMRLFYAHLYLGLYYEAAGKEELARKHLYKAADDHRIGHYMWDVAHVHANILRSKEKKKKCPPPGFISPGQRRPPSSGCAGRACHPAPPALSSIYLRAASPPRAA